jgi:NTE family protein
MLVLGGGGILGEAWMLGVLAGIEQQGGFDPRDCGGFIGTSAGSIVAATLAAGIPPAARLADPRATSRTGTTDAEQSSNATRVPRGAGGAREAAAMRAGSDSDGAAPNAARLGLWPLQAVGTRAIGLADAIAGPLASVALAGSAPGGALVRRGLLRRLGAGRRSLAMLTSMVDREHVRWDGRLVIVAVDERSGRRVAFGREGAPDASVGTAVAASCAIPGFFRPVQVGGRSYVDGGVWSPTNLDLARVRRGEHVLCLNPTGSLRPTAGALAGAIGPVSRTIAATEARALRARGAHVTIVNPDRDSASAMGVNLMSPARRSEVVAAALAQGLEIGRAESRSAA